jgi:DNA-damage-inducible protein J
MAKDGYLSARIDKSLMDEVHAIFSQLGVSRTEALTIFYSQVRLTKGLPFPVRIPNIETQQTFEKTDSGEDLHSAKSPKDLFCQLEM